MGLREQIAEDVHDRIARRDWHGLRRDLREMHAADVSDLLSALTRADQGLVFRLLGKRRSEVFAYLPPDSQQRLVRESDPVGLAAVIRGMSADDRARMFERLPADVAHHLLARLPQSGLRESLAMLAYPAGVAGRFMTPEYATIGAPMTAGEALLHLRRTGRGKDTLNVVYVLDDEGRLLEDVRLGGLVLADPSTPVLEIPDPGVVFLEDTTPVNEVVRAFEKYDRVALPVVDASRRMLGIITVDDVLDVAETRATEDIQKLGGSEALDAPYPSVGFGEMVKKRGGWLAVLFFGEMLTATAMSHYEEEIARAVVLALFVPLIISSGGNSGSQAASIIIRSLALGELTLGSWWYVLRRELASGVTLGAALGAIGFLRIVLWQELGITDYGPHFVLVAITVWLSLIGVVTFGTLAGSLLPFLLRRLGFDPATSSAPFVATLVDVTGLVIYFRVGAWLLKGALL